MDAILFSANSDIVDVRDAIEHLKSNEQLYWEVGFNINPDRFPKFPIDGYIHVTGSKVKDKKVKYRVKIIEIIPFCRDNYEDRNVANRVKPERWRYEWRMNINNIRDPHKWKNSFIITNIERFDYDTLKFRQQKKYGVNVKHPPQNYIRVLPPEKL